MFNERDALKIRLDQMSNLEKKFLETIHKERSYILERLSELDEQEAMEQITNKQQDKNKLNQTYYNNNELFYPKKRKGRPSRRSKTTKLKEFAINLLKETQVPIRGIDLKEQIEAKSDSEIANMTTFMNTIMKSDPHIIKVGRGLYAYEQGAQLNRNLPT